MKILNGRFPNDSEDNFDVSPHTIAVGAPRSPASRRTMDRSVFTLPSERKTVRTGGSIVVTKERLVFRLDPANDTRRSGLQSVSEGETQSVRESVHSEPHHVYVSAGFSSFIRKKLIRRWKYRDMHMVPTWIFLCPALAIVMVMT